MGNLWVGGRMVRVFSIRKMGVGWRGTGLGIKLMVWEQFVMGRATGLKVRFRGGYARHGGLPFCIWESAGMQLG
jgi:hypothetical protein